MRGGVFLAEVITVLSGKGGVGKSTFCANIGKALSKNKKVLLIDGDISFRSLDILLGLDREVVFDWSDVIFNRCTKEKALLSVSGSLCLLASPLSEPNSFGSAEFLKLVSEYKDMYDFIFIDAPAGFNSATRIYAKAADEIIVIATPDSISLRAAYMVGENLLKEGAAENQIRLVLNKADFRHMKNGVQKNLDDAVDKTYLRLLGVIPADKLLAVAGDADSNLISGRTTEAFLRISERILGKDVKLYI